MKHLKEIIKKPVYLFFSALLLMVLIVSILFFIGLKQASNKIDEYGNEFAALSGSLNKIDETIRHGFVKINSSELFINNANKILSTVYFGTADLGKTVEAKNFTAFAMLYGEKFYIITAGHCVEMEGEKYDNFKFKSNRGNSWIMPELLDYKSDYKNNLDYAIFYMEKPVSTGLIPIKPGEDLKPIYVLGNLERNLNLVKMYGDAKDGESGSPILNSNCHVVGLIIKSDGTYTPIAAVLSALAKLAVK